MKDCELTSEEQRTQQAYRLIAATRSKAVGAQPFDPEFWRSAFEKFKNLLSAGRIIDIGCGNGRDATLFRAEPNYHYVGVDLSEEMLHAARELIPETTFLPMNLYMLAFPKESFDGFWAASVYIHIPKRRVVEAIMETRRVVRSGAVGFIVMREGAGEKMIPGKIEGQERFYALYSAEEFACVLRSSGFEIIETSRDVRNSPELLYFVRAS